jgi:hypothetical protein
MGYCMHQHEANFRIPADNKPAALAALHERCNSTEGMTGAHYKAGQLVERYFAWVDMDELRAATTLEAACAACGWSLGVAIDGTGDIVEIYFEWEKIGDEDILFATLAPFVDDGSYIHMIGEDGEHWRWIFKGGTMRKQHARMAWD